MAMIVHRTRHHEHSRERILCRLTENLQVLRALKTTPHVTGVSTIAYQHEGMDARRFERFRELSTRQKAKQCWKIDKRTIRKIDHAEVFYVVDYQRTILRGFWAVPSEETFQRVLTVIMYQSITEDTWYIYI